MTVTMISQTQKRVRVSQGARAVVALVLVAGGAYWAGHKEAAQGAKHGSATTANRNAGDPGDKGGKNDKSGGDHGGGQSKSAGGENPSGAGGSAPATVTLKPEGMALAGLKVEPVAPQTLSTHLSVTGIVVPGINQEAQVTPRLAGKVLTSTVNIGDTVRVGQVLAMLASPELGTAQEMVHDATLRRNAALVTLNRQKQYARLGEYGTPGAEQARLAEEQILGEVGDNRNQVAVAQRQVTQEQAKSAALEAALTQTIAQRDFAEKKLARDRRLLDALLVSRQEVEQDQAEAAKAAADVGAAQANLREAQARIEAARKTVQAVRDRLANSEHRVRIAARQREREEKILRSGIRTQEQVGNAQTAYDIASHEVEAAETHVRLLGGDPEGDGTLRVLAPINGRVSARMFAPGENVMPDKPMFTLLDTTFVVVQLTVYQEDLSHLRMGQKIAVTCETVPDATWQAEVQLISEEIDTKTRTAKVNCLVRNPGKSLRPGMYVTGTIDQAARARTLAVPQEAVQTIKNVPNVFVPTGKPGEFQARAVQTGETVNGQTQILNGAERGRAGCHQKRLPAQIRDAERSVWRLAATPIMINAIVKFSVRQRLAVVLVVALSYGSGRLAGVPTARGRPAGCYQHAGSRQRPGDLLWPRRDGTKE